MKKQIKKEPLYDEMAKILIPQQYLNDFEIVSVENNADCWVIYMEEKVENIPKELTKKEDVVMDGFCTSIDILSHAFSLKKIYIRIRRRRWKYAGADKYYTNTYNFHPEGSKITPEMAFFFEAIDRASPDQYYNDSPNI